MELSLKVTSQHWQIFRPPASSQSQYLQGKYLEYTSTTSALESETQNSRFSAGQILPLSRQLHLTPPFEITKEEIQSYHFSHGPTRPIHNHLSITNNLETLNSNS
jgi:hypothetical protein